MVNVSGYDLNQLRHGFGLSASAFATHSELVPDEYWLVLSGRKDPDYNMGFIYGGDVVEHSKRMMAEITAKKLPSVVMLGGEGLSAATTFADAGWVCVSAMPFMAGVPQLRDIDPNTRIIGEDYLPRCLEIATQAFTANEETVSAVFSSSVVSKDTANLYGGFIDDELACTMVACRGDRIVTGWGLATDPKLVRGGMARRLISTLFGHSYEERPDTIICCMATPQGQPLYQSLGINVLEHLQVWSRPRWILGKA